MTSQSYLAQLLAFGLSIAAAPASAAPEAPWLVGRISPRWAEAKPCRTLQTEHDVDKTDEKNGAALAQVVQGLEPGDMLEIGPGRYSIASKFVVDLRGTAKDPIWIVGADSDRLPIITRPDSRQNVVNVGERSRTKYVCFRHLELTGGSTLIRFYDCHHFWLDQCHLHHAGHEGITTNTRDTSHLFITRNHVHDTNYPCILAYGTDGTGINVIEENICYRSNDNVLQVQGEAVVRNNLLIAA
jgi:hypothetical protein